MSHYHLCQCSTCKLKNWYKDKVGEVPDFQLYSGIFVNHDKSLPLGISVFFPASYEFGGAQRRYDAWYATGMEPPRYPMPAIPVSVGWQPTGVRACVGVGYWYVCNQYLLWTFWEKFGLVEERS